MRYGLLIPVTLALLLGPVNQASAAPIATIDGIYDAQSLYGGGAYDTPTLVFHNTSAYDFVGGQLVLTGYQGTNNNKTQTLSLPTMPAGMDFVLVWTNPSAGLLLMPPGSTNAGAPTASFINPGDLFTYDYDDSYGTNQQNVGNFSVTFTATLSGAGPLNGQPIFSVFSPNSNVTGGFVGWEGLDQNGFNETSFDDHNGTPNGVLAVINIGTPAGPAAAPEPATLAVFGVLGLTGGFYARRRAKVAA